MEPESYGNQIVEILTRIFTIRTDSSHPSYGYTRAVYVVFTKIPLLCVCYSVQVALNVSTRVVPRNDDWKLTDGSMRLEARARWSK